MDKLTFILILAGIAVVLLVAMFTYYKHHKKINDEIGDFNHHNQHSMEDVLLDHPANKVTDAIDDCDLPGSFTASRQEHFNIDQVNISHEQPDADKPLNDANERQLVDGVYINSKRVIKHSVAEMSLNESTLPSFSKNTETFAQQHKSTQEEARKVQTNDTTPVQTEVAKKQRVKVVYDAIAEGVDELIISHTVLTKGDFFSAAQLYTVFDKVGLVYGDMNIFHFPGDDQTESYALFSVANVVEPGTFEVQDIDMKTPGISLFMRLPSRIDNQLAYDKFIDIAKKIALELNAELCDETRSQLTQQAIAYKKEQIKKLDFELIKAQKLAEMER